jgi:2-oxo-4-hydroxy-4-carboxy-5-ureidoimidazoline decarboxylase
MGHDLFPPGDAVPALLACCAAPAWAAAMANGRPYPDLAAVLRAADTHLARLDWAEVETALAAHPRIGERVTVPSREAAWSRREQSAAASADPAVLSALANANVEYERVFDRVFLINATGRSAEEILVALRQRLRNDEDTERAVVRAELRGIVHLRLRAWLS